MIGFGKVNLARQGASYFAGIVEAPFMRKSAKDAGLLVTGSDHTAMVSDYTPHGAIYFTKVKHAPNAVILLQSQWTSNGLPLRAGGMFVRLRPTAPLIVVNAKVPTGTESKLPSDMFMMFTGRGDIMNAEELQVLGVKVPRSYQSNFMDAEELDECYDVREMAPEMAPRPSIARIATHDNGTRLVEVPTARRRRLIIRR